MDATSGPDFAIILPRLALDLVSISILLFGLYIRTHKRHDIAVVYLACNVGLFSVLTILSFSPLSSSIGFALFGVLSIIRLRSFEYTHQEIAYFFVALSIALVSAIDLESLALPGLLIALLLILVGVADISADRHPVISMVVILDRCHTDETVLQEHLTKLVPGEVVSYSVVAKNALQETTTVNVLYRK